MDDSVLSTESFDDRYNVLRRDRSNEFLSRFSKDYGGGVATAYLKRLHVVVRSDRQSEYVEDKHYDK